MQPGHWKVLLGLALTPSDLTAAARAQPSVWARITLSRITFTESFDSFTTLIAASDARNTRPALLLAPLLLLVAAAATSPEPPKVLRTWNDVPAAAAAAVTGPSAASAACTSLDS
jgi:hypothetical protein